MPVPIYYQQQSVVIEQNSELQYKSHSGVCGWCHVLMHSCWHTICNLWREIFPLTVTAICRLVSIIWLVKNSLPPLSFHITSSLNFLSFPEGIADTIHLITTGTQGEWCLCACMSTMCCSSPVSQCLLSLHQCSLSSPGPSPPCTSCSSSLISLQWYIDSSLTKSSLPEFVSFPDSLRYCTRLISTWTPPCYLVCLHELLVTLNSAWPDLCLVCFHMLLSLLSVKHFTSYICPCVSVGSNLFCLSH